MNNYVGQNGMKPGVEALGSFRAAQNGAVLEGASGESGERRKSPVVIFEWELPRDQELAGILRGVSGSSWSPKARAQSVAGGGELRWTGDIDARLGYAPGGFGRSFAAWSEALHPEDRPRMMEGIERGIEGGAPFYARCRLQRGDGSYLECVASGYAPRDGRRRARRLCVTLSDWAPAPEDEATDPRAAMKQAEQEKARAQSLLRTAAHLNAQLDLDEVCQAICEEAARVLDAPSAVMLFNRSRDAFVPQATMNMPDNYAGRYIPTERAIYNRHVAEMGTLFLFTDAQATPDLPNHRLYTEVNMRTIGIASLIREGEVLGLLKVYSFGESRTFDANELALLQGLADQAAQAIANARFYSESQRRLANLGALRQIDSAILGSSEVGVALNVVLDQTVTRMGADAADILLLNHHTRLLRHAGARGFHTAQAQRMDWRLGEGWAGRAAQERRIVWVPDLERPDDVITSDFHSSGVLLNSGRASSAAIVGAGGRNRELIVSESFCSYYAVPLLGAGQVKGVLEVWKRSPLRFDEEELAFLETLAGQAAIAIDNAQLFRELQGSNDELVTAYDSTLSGWSGALDLRDKETEGHTQRVTAESLRLAEVMGLSDADLVQIRRGALLHDIGKMGIPDAILLKPGPLTDEEWVIMKMHPTYALELLSPIEYLRPALDIPYAHHEKWDGSGYPRGLSGTQIPLSARIFAVVDVWDALCSDRPYRAGWPIARVLEHIKNGSGTHFDPEVVAAFIEMHAEELSEDGGEVMQGARRYFQATKV